MADVAHELSLKVTDRGEDATGDHVALDLPLSDATANSDSTCHYSPSEAAAEFVFDGILPGRIAVDCPSVSDG